MREDGSLHLVLVRQGVNNRIPLGSTTAVLPYIKQLSSPYYVWPLLERGEKGFISVSTDGGDTWAPPPKGTFPDIFTFMRDVDFAPSGRVGMIVGQTGRIYLSTDAGYQWQQILGETTG